MIKKRVTQASSPTATPIIILPSPQTTPKPSLIIAPNPRPMTDQENLVEIARKFIGVTDQGPEPFGYSKVLQFLLSVDKAPYKGEPWCAAFVFYCLEQTGRKHDLHKSPSAMDMWSNSPRKLVLDRPEIGAIAVWNFNHTHSGHCGIVSSVNDEYDVFTSIEGNTSKTEKYPGEPVVRNGGYVAEKIRHINPPPSTMVLMGFLRPWTLVLVPDLASDSRTVLQPLGAKRS